MGGLGQLMNPMQPQARTPMVPPASMVAPNAPRQPAPPPSPAGGTPPAGSPPMGTGMNPAIMPQMMPDITQLLMQRALMGNQGGMTPPGVDPQATMAAPGLQTAPVRGTTPMIGGR